MQEPVQPVVPFRDSKLAKKEQIEEMFDKIAFRYDFLNHFLSMGIDRSWRRKALRFLAPGKPRHLLDVATGTADVAVMAARILKPDRITGVDLSEKMLDIGRRKIRELQLPVPIELLKADSEALPFEDRSFDAISVAFGVRNFEHLDQGLSEMLRVLKPGGRLVILEFSRPTAFPVRQLFEAYFRYITPYIGKWFARSKEAYAYLPESVQAFPQGSQMTDILTKIGYSDALCKPLTFGICSIYSASRP